MLQTTFRNPLADPSILGINSGASLGVALVMLGWGGSISTAGFTLSGFILVLLSAFAGAMIVMGIILLFSTWVRSNLILLIVGIMALLSVQVFLNIGVVTNLIPNTGISLPFFSYGGSSLWGFTILLFIMLRIDVGRNRLKRI